jgi:hypothetical protein
MDFLKMLGWAEACPGWKSMWWGSMKCKLRARHRGPHRNGRHTWPYGTG